MLPYGRAVTALLLSAGFTTAVWAAEPPVAVSPGDASKVAQVEDRCPTFSWGEVEGAKSYELVVYRLGEQGEESQPVLRQSFAGSVDGWTPALDQCLERGGRYVGAKAAAAALKDGVCGLTDGSVPGQWRLPEIGEICSEDSPTPTAGACPPASATDSLMNTNFSNPPLSNAAGVAQWTTDGDAFVGVLSQTFWSATEVDADSAWVPIPDGQVLHGSKDTNYYVWPVRGGQ